MFSKDNFPIDNLYNFVLKYMYWVLLIEGLFLSPLFTHTEKYTVPWRGIRYVFSR